MRGIYSVLIVGVLSSVVVAEELPREIENFVWERNLCDHFRGEDYEGGTPSREERRNFILESLEMYCSGTDARLRALKTRHRDNASVQHILSTYDEEIERKCDCS